jgi:hypothetical protein
VNIPWTELFSLAHAVISAHREQVFEDFDSAANARIAECAEKIVLDQKPGMDPRVVLAAESYLEHAFNETRKHDLRRTASRDSRRPMAPSSVKMPDFK